MNKDRKLYILCGGQSRRMGSDKALLELEGESLLKFQIEKTKPYFEEIVLLSGSNNYPLKLRQLPDKIENSGPLAGLLEALKDSRSKGHKYAAIVPVDLPNLRLATIKKISEWSSESTFDASIIGSGEDLQPLAGIYKSELADIVESYLKTGNRMVFGILNRIRFSKIEADPKELINLNTPGDFINYR